MQFPVSDTRKDQESFLSLKWDISRSEMYKQKHQQKLKLVFLKHVMEHQTTKTNF
jgi:hypothetical protein